MTTSQQRLRAGIGAGVGSAGPLVAPPRYDGNPLLAGLFAAGTLVWVLVLWLHGGAADAMQLGSGSAATTLGRLTGLLSADLLLLQVLLMARVPAVERAFGQDRLAGWHRLTGFWSVNLMVVHVVLITVGYAVTDRQPLPGKLWNLITTYPGMLLATAATAALLLVAATSIHMARRKLRYESWHLLHLYAYLGVAFALPHELWTGQDFINSAATRFFWWTFYLATLGAVLFYRLGMPIYRSIRHDVRVSAVVPEQPGVYSVYLTGRNLDRLPVRAGQFMMWRFLGRRGWTRAQPYSLSAAPRSRQLRITVKELGDGSAAVADLKPGARAWFEGPYGGLTGAARTRTGLLFMACGIGVTPLRALLEAEPFRPGEAVLLYRARSETDLTFRAELEQLAAARGIHLRYLLGPRGPHGSFLPASAGNPDAALHHLVPDLANRDVYLCGPQPWTDAAIEVLYRLGAGPDQIHEERFAW